MRNYKRSGVNTMLARTSEQASTIDSGNSCPLWQAALRLVRLWQLVIGGGFHKTFFHLSIVIGGGSHKTFFHLSIVNTFVNML